MWWTATPSRRRRRLELLLAAALWLYTDVAHAQPATDVVIGSATAGLRLHGRPGEQALLRHPPLRFVEQDGPAEGRGDLPAHTVGPFDASRYGFEYLDVYFDRSVNPDEAPQSEGEGAEATLRLLVAARAANRPTRWWRLVPGNPRAADGGYSDELRFAPLTITAHPGGAGSPDDDRVPEHVRLATPDSGLPMLDIVFGARSSGANSTVTVTRHLVVDWTAPLPRAVALLEDVEYRGGGACNAHDTIYDVRTEIGCRWDPYRRDFLCARTLHRYDTKWGIRRGSDFFLLDAGTRVPSPHVVTLDAFTRSLRDADRGPDPGEPAWTSLDGHGEVTLVDVVHIGRRKVALLAAPSLSAWFGVRWLAIVTDDHRRTTLHAIAPRTWLGPPITSASRADAKDDGPVDMEAVRADGEALRTLTPDGLLIEVDSVTLSRTETRHVLEARVREGRGRGVYLVGLELDGDRFIGDALLVATDAPTYDACNTWTLLPTAVGMTVTATPVFSAALDVEPSRRLDADGRLERHERPACRATATARWNAGAGFDVGWTRPPCAGPEALRRTRIDDEGRISSRP